MTEPSVPVPVSLIERLRDTYGREDTDGANLAVAAILALLSQPTAPAEADWPKQTTQPGVTEEESMRRIDRSVGKLPSIADLAPGTTFEYEGERWKVLHDGLAMCEHGGYRNLTGFDPSTIRDVTPSQ